MVAETRVAAIELGGTKSIAILAEGNTVVDQVSVPTTTPEETLPHLRDQLKSWHAEKPFSAIGIASFGPVQLRRQAENFGSILKTPKPFWTNADVAGELTSPFDCPWAIDTDVNGAALAEYRWGAGQGCTSICYITIGTGVGGGLVINGQPVHGFMHPEVGHVRTRRSPNDAFAGACPFHGDCIEGLVSGPALAARFGRPMSEVNDADPLWMLVANDIAELVSLLLLTTSAERVLFGGGVSTSRPFLLPLVQKRAHELLAGYLPIPQTEDLFPIVRQAELDSLAGPLGAIALAHSALGI